MDSSNEKYLLIGGSKYDFGDHSPERMKDFNDNLKKIIRERRAQLKVRKNQKVRSPTPSI